jgi:mycoredoxin
MNGKALLLLLAAIVAVMFFQHKGQPDKNDPRLSTGNDGIVLLSAQWCGYCKALRASLTAHSVPFREMDVETSSEGARAYRSLHGSGIPITVVGQNVVYGYDVRRVDELLKPLGFEIH